MTKFNSKGFVSPLLMVGMALVVVFLIVAYSAPLSKQLLSTIFPKDFSFAASPGVAFVDSNNQPVSQTTTANVKLQLTSPWAVKSAVSDKGFQFINEAAAQTSNTVTLTATGNANEDGSFFATNQSLAWIGNGASTTNSLTSFRFTNVNLPKGAKITSAKLQVYSPQTPWISVKTDIYSENVGNSADFSNTAKTSTRVLTTAKISYSKNDKWKSNTWYELGDVRGSVQEVVNRTDWNVNNSLSLILKGTGRAYGRKYIQGTGANAAKLVITYSGTGGVVAPAPSASVNPSPVISPSPVQVYITSAKVAEDSGFTKNVQDVNPFVTNPTVIDFAFSDSTLGTKTVYVRFVSTTGEEKVFSSTIEVVQPLGSAMPSDHNMGGEGSNSHAMGLWTPNPIYDTCSKDQHDGYKVQGPDGKWYPTWHPPVDPATGCKFGHEHGRDPKLSALWSFIQQQYGYDVDRNGKVEGAELATAGLPFGYANEKLDEYNLANNITMMRHEDHVGHKIEWENNVLRTTSPNYLPSSPENGFGKVATKVYCDFLMKPHQGTHSKDAFTNNMHELGYFVQCRDAQGGGIGTQIASYKMVLFGKKGGFTERGAAGSGTTGTRIEVGSATPPNGPDASDPSRLIATIGSILEHVLVPSGQWSRYSEGIYEDWISGNYLMKPDGNWVAYYDPHFAVFSPSRFYWSGSDSNSYGITRTTEDKANNIGRSVDLCFMNENGEIARGGECDYMTNYGQIKSMAWDDPRSAFNGIKREMYFNQTGIHNQSGATYWYTDPFGNKASTTPFPGALRHFVSPVDNEKRTTDGYIDPNGIRFPFESEAIGGNRSYGGNGVHAPN